MENQALRLRVAVQRPSTLNASGLIVDGRSSTRCSRSRYKKAVTRGLSRTTILEVCRQALCSQVAALHLITRSARSRIDCGTVMPRAVAVLRFTTSSNVADWSMGRSPGFAPLRILSTYIASRRYVSVKFSP